MVWIVPAAIAVLLLIVGVALWRWRGRRAVAGIEDAEAGAAAAETIPGFDTIGALVGEDRAAALVAGQHGRVAVVKRRGARLAAREVRWDRVRAVADGMLIETGDRRFGTVLVAGINVLDVRRLAPSLQHP